MKSPFPFPPVPMSINSSTVMPGAWTKIHLRNAPSPATIIAKSSSVIAILLLPTVPFNGCIVSLHLAVNMTGQTISADGVHVMGDFQEAAGFSQNWDADFYCT